MRRSTVLSLPPQLWIVSICEFRTQFRNKLARLKKIKRASLMRIRKFKRTFGISCLNVTLSIKDIQHDNQPKP